MSRFILLSTFIVLGLIFDQLCYFLSHIFFYLNIIISKKNLNTTDLDVKVKIRGQVPKSFFDDSSDGC